MRLKIRCDEESAKFFGTKQGLSSPQKSKKFKIPHRIESYGTYIKH